MSFTLAILSLRELVVEIDPLVPTCSSGRLLDIDFGTAIGEGTRF